MTDQLIVGLGIGAVFGTCLGIWIDWSFAMAKRAQELREIAANHYRMAPPFAEMSVSGEE